MTPDLFTAFLQNPNFGFGVLFVGLFVWVLKTNDAREKRYLSLLDCYGTQLQKISDTLEKIQQQTEDLVKKSDK